ncbi:hypothetical protein [Paenibacillus apiarius]|uniref:Cardiolipin synthase N-terminal domain-containing protein n=1 Tax=Paenibacillus apiarius TaxID=46240 RepID=A0ABT4DQU3_9BACL|nr:hypothetical protein [Paenibacillus apiarius]MBN3524890.1 hypothetical protein [Paenibacillus apiarius]MCY9515243.1 hypothetical protein [Paenibacillus apiarius]MCY9519120.1 hypothetical protein [Paenibacillus apiarius]MCY9550298.1 hypothetical protein [Paenibacillus apiarius]MCY9561152.1 hypothetical protein [Paenibacillus apiarius]
MLYFLIWLISWIMLFWIWGEASDRRGKHIGCLWALVVFSLGPLGVILYLIVRNWD